MKMLYFGSNEKKISELNKIEAKLAERKYEMNSLKIHCENNKRKLNNMEQVHMGYRKRDIWKVNEFNFLNEEVEEFTSRWSQNLVNVRNSSYLKQKN